MIWSLLRKTSLVNIARTPRRINEDFRGFYKVVGTLRAPSLGREIVGPIADGTRSVPATLMLPRILEPEVMDSAEEARDYDAMDHSQVNSVFVADFLAHYSGDAPVLDVGTGTAQIPIELCRRHPTVAVAAIDASPAMIALAQENVARAGFEKRIRLRVVDAKALPFADASFSAVMSNSIVHHIPDPALVLAEMIRVVAPGGILFVRDLLRPETDADVAKLVAQYASDANAQQKKLFDDSLHAALSLAEIRGLIAAVGFPSETVQQTTDRHWTWTARWQLMRPFLG
jgi:ubiquinone/menaquinone biosynthesis C-methylase UbiE